MKNIKTLYWVLILCELWLWLAPRQTKHHAILFTDKVSEQLLFSCAQIFHDVLQSSIQIAVTKKGHQQRRSVAWTCKCCKTFHVACCSTAPQQDSFGGSGSQKTRHILVLHALPRAHHKNCWSAQTIASSPNKKPSRFAKCFVPHKVHVACYILL